MKIKIAKYKTATSHQVMINSSGDISTLGDGEKIEILSANKNEIRLAIGSIGSEMKINKTLKDSDTPWRVAFTRANLRKVPNFGLIDSNFTVKGNIITVKVPSEENRGTRRKRQKVKTTVSVKDPLARVKKSVKFLNELNDSSITFDIDDSGKIIASVIQKIRL